MLKFSWRNGLAVGLTLGGCLATLLILFGQFAYDLAQCNHNSQCDRYAAKYEGEDFPSSWWWLWEGSLVASKDTLAQWIMAFFTIAVVILVWRTLVATQAIAADTREIGEAQVRAYVYVTDVKISITSNALEVVFTNFGNSPGNISFVDCKVLISDPYRPEGPKIIWSQAFWHDGFQLGPQGPKEIIFRLDRGRGKYLEGKIEEDGIGVFVQGKFQSIDVFGIKTVQGIDIILSDGVRA